MQEVCDINIMSSDSQFFFSEKKSDIVQKQDTEFTRNISDTEFTKSIKQSCQYKSRFNLLSTH